MQMSNNEGLQGRAAEGTCDVIPHSTLPGRSRRTAQPAGCSQGPKYSEMLKHVFDTEQGPLRISVSSVSIFSHMIKKPVHFAGNLHTGQGASKHQSHGPCSKHICSSRGFRAILAKARWDIRDVRSRLPVSHQLSHKGFVAP